MYKVAYFLFFLGASLLAESIDVTLQGGVSWPPCSVAGNNSNICWFDTCNPPTCNSQESCESTTYPVSISFSYTLPTEYPGHYGFTPATVSLIKLGGGFSYRSDGSIVKNTQSPLQNKLEMDSADTDLYDIRVVQIYYLSEQVSSGVLSGFAFSLPFSVVDNGATKYYKLDIESFTWTLYELVVAHGRVKQLVNSSGYFFDCIGEDQDSCRMNCNVDCAIYPSLPACIEDLI